MKFLKPVLALVLLICLFMSCKNDLQLNAAYKEIPSIFAILNPQNSIQIIRINKIFLGNGDANQMAQVADSINYPADELLVTLTRKNEYGANDFASRNNKTTVVFHDSIIQAQAGAFSQTQRVYVTSDRLFVTGKYTLTVKNTKTGNVFTAQATALDSVKGQQPLLPLGAPYYPYLPTAPPNDNSAQFINYKDVGGTVSFIPIEAKNGDIYSLTMRFHFSDSLYGNPNRVYHYVDYPFGNKTIKDVRKIGNNTFMQNDFKAVDLFSSLGISLSKMGLSDNVAGRFMDRIEYIIYTSSQDYIDYMQYVAPSLSISQSKPLYSNFNNQAALGLFTFRTRCSVSKEMADEFKTEFAYNSYTCRFRFFKTTAPISVPGCQ